MVFLKVFIGENKFLFSAWQLLLFSPELCRLNCVLLCHSSLLIISTKDKKTEVFSCFKKARGEFLARIHTISLNKQFLKTSCLCVHANVCTLERTDERGNHKRQSMQWVQNTWSIGTGLCQCIVSKQTFSWFRS